MWENASSKEPFVTFMSSYITLEIVVLYDTLDRIEKKNLRMQHDAGMQVGS